MEKFNLLDPLGAIDPAGCSYQEWVNVGMALKQEGYAVNEWDEWSQLDSSRYHAGECEKKWEGFNGNTSPVTGATITQMAKEFGWAPKSKADRELGWDEMIYEEDIVILDKSWVEGKDLPEVDTNWKPVNDLITYLKTLFDSSDNVGYVTDVWETDDGKYSPKKGNWDRTAGQLIEQLSNCKGDIGAVIGDSKEECGAWIRFNPLDGKGCKNENVTDYKYALVESDTMPLEQQYEILQSLELPIACLVHTGNKSLHAIVKVDAKDLDEYRKRVDYIYMVCKKNGFAVDTQNKNPSRLSRMPGVMRGEKPQYLIATNIGQSDYITWKEWIEAVNDDLPDPESLSVIWDNLPPLAPPLIDGILRQGHKMLLAGPSKAGKSYALIELCIAIAEGADWLGFNCTKGRVLYCNLELDRASCLHRFKDVYEALGYAPTNINNIDIWNLRGKSVPMDQLAPKLIRRAQKKGYMGVIIDPIYKVITGDENSADQMAKFCNQFDKVCTELGCSVIYCHHHSKGSQGGKRSMDRASGSGVFARDPDALLDMIELDVKDETQDKAGKPNNTTAWRIEGTLREYPRFEPVNVWFEYPIHTADENGWLTFADADGEQPWKKGGDTMKRKAEQKQAQLEMAFASTQQNGVTSLKELGEYMELKDSRSVKKYVEQSDLFEMRNGLVYEKGSSKS